MQLRPARAGYGPLWTALRRNLSAPERLALGGLAVTVAAAGWPTVAAQTGLGAPCPLRWLTGVPCPFCGLTAASVALVRADLDAALAANPAVIGLAGLTACVLPLLALRWLGLVAPPAPWSPRARRAIGRALVLLALASWLYQLNRLGVR